MTYTRLPLATFKALYPQFSTLDEIAYSAWAAKVERTVNDRYGDDQQDASELLLAHYLSLNGVGIGATGEMALNGATSFESGDFKVQLATEAVTARGKSGYGSTVYGQQFLTIQRRLFGTPYLVGCI
jgi:hypothetical protein